MSLPLAPSPKSPLATHRLLSPTASIKISPICLGTMNFGEVWKELSGECTKETAFSILDTYHRLGGNFLDTANMYMAGETETWLGEYFSLRNNRDEFVLATKYSQPLKYPFMEPPNSNATLSNYAGNNKKSLRLSLESSLKRLQTEYVDLLYVHAWEGTTGIPELMRALDDVVRQGKILYLGVSNWPAYLVASANAYARAHNLTPFVVYEGRWNAAERDIEREIVPMCKAEGMGITVWSALGGGRFKTASQRQEAGGRAYNAADLGTASDEHFEVVRQVLEKVAERHDTSPTGVALRYITLKAPYIFPIVGGRKLEHLTSNIEALRIELSEEDITEIDSATPFDLGYPYTLLSGKNEHVSAERPAALVYACGNFAGVAEPNAIGRE
ncbi:oxidoreductase [Zopfia rhizophila CBS 207.26]|uniref:Oxidoreductase n=1 Tax=Zopfia rhizophila CBS 207.26 TaxID=1314779 RepID=A0A6A6DF55_9PEZI|nr:oxidoreductase [Zopfia rhizophila CBS 207.26]